MFFCLDWTVLLHCAEVFITPKSAGRIFTRLGFNIPLCLLMYLCLFLWINVICHVNEWMDLLCMTCVVVITVTSHERQSVIYHWQLDRLLNSLICLTPSANNTHPHYCTVRPPVIGGFFWNGRDTMMTSSNWHIFRVTGPLWRETSSHRWIPLTKASDAELWCFLPEQTVKQTIETPVI